MAESEGKTGADRWSRWRLVMWSGAAALLSLPLVAMQFTREVDWDIVDFAVIGAMLLAACGTCEMAAKLSRDTRYRIAFGIAVAAAFVLVWMNLAVGIIGNEDNRANALFGGVLAVGFVGAIAARFRPAGMAWALVATALAQTLVGVIALFLGYAYVLLLTAFFVALWLGSAALFRKASKEHASGRAAPAG